MKKYFDDIDDIRNYDHKRQPTPQELAEVPPISDADFKEIVRSPEYKHSPLIQRLVMAGVTKAQRPDYVADSLRIGNKSVTMSDGSDGGEREEKVPFQILEARQAKVKAMFRDPRYKTDAAYRQEVSEFLQGYAANDAKVDEKIMRQGGGVTQVGFSTKADEGAAIVTNRQNSYQAPFQGTGPNKPAPKEKAVDPNAGKFIDIY